MLITYDLLVKSVGTQPVLMSVIKGLVGNGLINKVIVCSQKVHPKLCKVLIQYFS